MLQEKPINYSCILQEIIKILIIPNKKECIGLIATRKFEKKS